MRHSRLSLLILFGTLGIGSIVFAERIDPFSFRPPFDKVDKEGKRVINDTWIYGGSTDPKKNFIRLTTDRQSKRGFIWSSDSIERDTLSLVLSFRISGVGKRWFGDGIGLWLTEHGHYIQGVNHGFTDNFKGIGIVIDTFNNPEHKGGHKDISIQVNDGTKTIDELTSETRIGCDAAVRFHEKNASFDPVHSISRVKVKIQLKKVVVEVDAGNNGRWIACASVDLPFSNAAWLKSTTLGITGATGALADNHDVISLETFTDFTDAAISNVDSQVILHTVSKDYKKWMDSPNCGTDCLIAVLQKELANFKIEAEHRFTDLKEKTEHNVAKLKKQDQENEQRVYDIEEKVAHNIDLTLHLTKKSMGEEMKEKITQQLETNPHVTSGWKTPFFFLLIGLSAGGAFVYRKYQELMKSHLL